MRKLRNHLNWLYRGLLACYPASIRREYGEEMRSVFEEACEQESSTFALLLTFLRELQDWPILVIEAHHDEFLVGGEERSRVSHAHLSSGTIESGVDMTDGDEIAPEGARQVAWMAMPILLLGLGIMIAALVRTDVWYRLPAWQLWLSMALTLLPGLIVGGVGLFAIVRRVPDWGITWVGCAFMGFALSTEVMLGELVDEGTITLAPPVAASIGLSLFLAGLVVLLILAVRGWVKSGLFTLAAAATMGLSLLQSVTAAPINRDDLALLAGPLGLVFALLIVAYVRGRSVNRGAVLLATAALNVGVAVLVESAWSDWGLITERATVIPMLFVLMTGLLASGPISGLLVKPIVNRWA